MIAADEDIESDDAEVADPLPDRVTWRADEDNDAATTRARRRLEMAHALAEMSLRMAAAVEARAVAAMEAPEPQPARCSAMSAWSSPGSCAPRA